MITYRPLLYGFLIATPVTLLPTIAQAESNLVARDTTTYFNESLTINAPCNQGDGNDCPFVLTSEMVAVPEGKILIIDYIAAFPGSAANAALRPVLSIRISGCLVFVGRIGSEGVGKTVVIPSVCSGSVSGFSASLSFSASGKRPNPTAFGVGGASFQQIIRATGRIVERIPDP